MRESGYADEGMDVKKYMLCMLGRLPLLLAAAAAGALLGALVYTIMRTVPEAEREYRAYAKVYLDFAADETGEVYQAYNGYTWNDLMAADPIMELTLARLSSDYTREEVEASIQAEILSDIRLLTVTVTTHSAERTDEILAAAAQALEAYGTQAKEFIEISTIQATQAKLLVADDRLVQAVLIGLFLGLFLTVLGVSLYYVMDDRILVAGDIEKVTDVSFLGYLSASESAEENAGKSAEKSVEESTGENSGKGVEESTGENAGKDVEKSAEENPGESIGENRTSNRAAGGMFSEDYQKNFVYLQDKIGTLAVCEMEPGKSLSEETLDALQKAQGAVLSIPFGKVRGTLVSYAIGQLKSRDIRLCGVAIRNCDRKFLRKYYGV